MHRFQYKMILLSVGLRTSLLCLFVCLSGSLCVRLFVFVCVASMTTWFSVWTVRAYQQIARYYHPGGRVIYGLRLLGCYTATCYSGSAIVKSFIICALAETPISSIVFNHQATKLFFCNISYQGGGGYHPFRYSVWFKISYCVIQGLIQHSVLSKMVYLDVNYMTANRNYEFLNTGTRLNVNGTIYH